MGKFFRLFDVDEGRQMSMRLVNLISLYIQVLSVAGLFVFYKLGVAPALLGAVLIFMFITGGIWVYSYFSKRYTVAAYALCFLLNIIMFPMLFILGGGLFSGMPIMFLGGYTLCFILLDGIPLVVTVVITAVWDMFVMAYSYYYPHRIIYLSQNSTMAYDIMFCFLSSTMVIVLVLWAYSGVYKMMRASILESGRSIEESGNVKNRFLANMSHELRTPMNAILGMAELLERGESGRDISFETTLIKDSAFSLLNTINNVLVYSQLDSGKMELRPQQFHFKKLLKDIIYTVNMELAEKNTKFFADIDTEIPDLLYGDEVRIRQVFQYILLNAVNETDDGRVAMKLTFRNNPKTNSITLFARVSDTGSGLTDDEKASVFNSFEIYDSKKYSHLKKIGLELTICKDILELMGGNIRVESINNVGTSVFFQFDIFYAEKAPIISVTRGNTARALIFVQHSSRTRGWTEVFGQFGLLPDIVSTYAAFDMKLRDKKYDWIFVSDYTYASVENLLTSYGCQDRTYIVTDYAHVYGDFGKCRVMRRPICSINLEEVINGTWKAEDYQDMHYMKQFEAPDARVLVVDDNMVNIKVMNGLLSRYKISPFTAGSGKEAISKCRDEQFDLIFLDQLMPEMDGPTTLHQIREIGDEKNKTVPIICMTANIGEDVKDDMIRLGFQDYLGKPIRVKYLDAILDNFLPTDLVKVKEKSEKQKTAPAVTAAPGLSVDVGLMRTGGDEEVYGAILNTYLTEGQKKIEDILDEHENGDLPMFIINVHAVKGSSAGIGGMEVSELFKELEMAGKAGDMDTINEKLSPAIDKYKELLELVKKYLAGHNMLESDDAELDKLEEEEFPADTMYAVRDYIEEFNTSLLEGAVEEWGSHNYGEEVNNYLAGIKKAVDNFDYDRAAEFVDEFIEVFLDDN